MDDNLTNKDNPGGAGQAIAGAAGGVAEALGRMLQAAGEPTAEAVRALEARLARLETGLEAIRLGCRAPDTLTVADIARLERVDARTLYRRRTLLPRFGASAFPEGAKRWTVEEYLDWRQLTPEQKRALWPDPKD